jgi:hypothetical protein
VAQTMYKHVSKCKNDEIKERKNPLKQKNNSYKWQKNDSFCLFEIAMKGVSL